MSVKLRQPIDGQCAWSEWLTEVNEQGVTVVVNDPRSEREVILEFDSIAGATSRRRRFRPVLESITAVWALPPHWSVAAGAVAGE